MSMTTLSSTSGFVFGDITSLKSLMIYAETWIFNSTSKVVYHRKCRCFLPFGFFASGCFQIVAGDTVNAHKSTVSRILHRVATTLRNRLNEWVTYPNQREADQQKCTFFAIARFPNVFGCVDGTHIKIHAPAEREDVFVNRKGYHSINVQLVCDADLRIINCVVKYPGSTHDARILTESRFCRDFDSPRPPVNGFVVGDSAYPLKEWLLTPFMNTNNDPTKERYNRCHSSTRQAIERCNGVLKRRFHCLEETLRYTPQRAVAIIMACIVLHNRAVHYKLPDPEEDDDGPDNFQPEPVADEHEPGVGARALRDAIVRDHFS